MFPPLVATVLTVYGIETSSPKKTYIPTTSSVATVLTVYGIETGNAYIGFSLVS